VSTGRIIIPRIGLNHATYEGIELSVIDYGPSHWPGTAEPGDHGNTVFPGHRVTKTRPFYNIDLIQVGDHVTFVRSHGTYTYEVTETFVVNADEVWIADQTEAPTMTIFGCHPKGSAKQRYVAKGRLVQSERSPAAPEPSGGSGGDGGGGSSEPAPPPTTTTTSPNTIKLPI
jgi:sortase A